MCRFVVTPQRELFFVGNPLRRVFAIFFSSAVLMDSYMPLEASRSDDLPFLPRFADRAAPAAICCFLDFAGIHRLTDLARTVSTGCFTLLKHEDVLPGQRT